MSKYTEGPWNAEWERFDKEIEIVSLSEGEVVAYVDYDDVEHDVAQANASLIAAAPHMFDVLEASAADPTDMTNWSDEQIRGWAYATARNAQNAIAKARGNQ